MAWGIFKKIGDGLKKAFNWTKNKIVKPVAKIISPVAKPLAGVVKTLVPGAAPIVDFAEGVVDKISGSGAANGGLVGAGGHGIRNDDDDWVKAFNTSRTLNKRIQLKD